MVNRKSNANEVKTCRFTPAIINLEIHALQDV